MKGRSECPDEALWAENTSARRTAKEVKSRDSGARRSQLSVRSPSHEVTLSASPRVGRIEGFFAPKRWPSSPPCTPGRPPSERTSAESIRAKRWKEPSSWVSPCSGGPYCFHTFHQDPCAALNEQHCTASCTSNGHEDNRTGRPVYMVHGWHVDDCGAPVTRATDGTRCGADLERTGGGEQHGRVGRFRQVALTELELVLAGAVRAVD